VVRIAHISGATTATKTALHRMMLRKMVLVILWFLSLSARPLFLG
jgi:hypothetical protein